MVQKYHAICIQTTVCLYYFFANTKEFSGVQRVFSRCAGWCFSLLLSAVQWQPVSPYTGHMHHTR